MILHIYRDSIGVGRCRSCGAVITWAELTSGKRHPFDGPSITPVAASEHSSGRVIEDVDTSMNRSHFQTCPHAADHRRRP